MLCLHCSHPLVDLRVNSFHVGFVLHLAQLPYLSFPLSIDACNLSMVIDGLPTDCQLLLLFHPELLTLHRSCVHTCLCI